LVGYVRIYTPKAKEIVRRILEKHLSKYNVDKYTDNFLTCIDELIKNAVKANYKFVLIREKIEEHLKNSSNPEKLTIDDILKDRELYNQYSSDLIKLPEITKVVRTALTQESKVISLKTKAAKEKRKYTEEEKTEILGFKELLDIQRKVKKYGARVQVRVNEIFNALNIEIMNNAPILNSDLERIHKKRKEFKNYADRGEEMMFFIENMDEADAGAGLGYATIDAGLRELQTDPFDIVSIISVTNTTILLYFKESFLKSLK
jgi:hypothetical protein